MITTGGVHFLFWPPPSTIIIVSSVVEGVLLIFKLGYKARVRKKDINRTKLGHAK